MTSIWDRLGTLFDRRPTYPELELEELVAGHELPSFPRIVTGALALLRDPEASMTEVAGLLEGDPALHVKVLQTVNSAAFAVSARVTSVHRAITLLGRARIEAVVLAHGVRHSLPAIEASSAPGLDGAAFWLTAARRATCARALARHLHPASRVESFTAGLLQDMAVPVMLQAHGARYAELLTRWAGGAEQRLDRLERQAFGYDHGAVGALMARRWDLPPTLAAALAGHHLDDPVVVEPAASIVSVLRYHAEPEAAREQMIELCQARHQLDPQRARQTLDQALHDAGQFARHLA